MAKGQTDSESPAWVPSGLKVRGSAPEITPLARPNTVSMSVLNTLPLAAEDAAQEGQAQISLLTDNLSRRSTDNLSETSRLPPEIPPANKPGFRPMPVLTILTLICLGILFWLGQWQWVKFVDKSKAPTAIAAIEPTSVAAALEAENPEYRPVIVEGISDPRTIKISTVQGGVRGYRLFSPVVLEVGGIFVDRGFVGEDDVSRVTPPTGQVRLNGVLRKGAKPNNYTPDNDPASDVWYWPDLTAMADMLVIQTTSSQHYVALTQVDPLATGNTIKNPYADSKGANQIEPERHLGYALTWWGFGLALIGVYIGLHVRTGRLVLRRATPS
jgi:surfeit locus 1 family protein